MEANPSPLNLHEFPQGVEPKTGEDHFHIHQGHPHVHRPHNDSFVFYTILISLVVIQGLIFFWRRNHAKSFKLFLVFALWFFPFMSSISNLFTANNGNSKSIVTSTLQFLFLWGIFSISTSVQLIPVVFTKPMSKTTPRNVFRYFDFMYRFTIFLMSACYTLILFLFFLRPFIPFVPTTIYDYIIKVFFYGAYFCIFTRDLTEVVNEYITNSLGFLKNSDDNSGSSGAPRGVCALCGDDLLPPEKEISALESGQKLAVDSARNSIASSDMIHGGNGEVLDLLRGAQGSLDHSLIQAPAESDAPAPVNIRHWYNAMRRKDFYSHQRAKDPSEGSNTSTPRSRIANANSSKILKIPIYPNGVSTEEVQNTFWTEDFHLYQLQCGHTFHSSCIKGWALVGKKGACPNCHEKVDLHALISNSQVMSKPTVLWGQILDIIRYFIVWIPLILLLVRLILALGGLDIIKEAKTQSMMEQQLVAEMHKKE
jgi:Ring finger domain